MSSSTKKPLRSPTHKIGIIGGGQLARMMALEAMPYGLEVHILSEKADDPAAQVTAHWHQGDPGNEIEQLNFCRKVDAVTFESEFHKMDSFMQIREAEGTFFFPQPEVMALLQDRKTQKGLLIEHKLPTAEFMLVSSKEDLHLAFKRWRGHFVLKKSVGGYDGYGTYFSHSEKDLEKLNALLPGHFLAEAFVPFKRELAVIVARSSNGSFTNLPLVETKQVQGKCDWVVGPVHHPSFAKFIKKIQKFLKTIDYVGVMGIELFDTGKDLLINEIAPRVHNSGHYSQQALKISQFLLHIQAGLGEQLQKPQLIEKSFCMINLIGGTQSIQFPTSLNGKLHWYGKSENRPGRKMGHLNYTGKNPQALLKLAQQERKKFNL